MHGGAEWRGEWVATLTTHFGKHAHACKRWRLRNKIHHPDGIIKFTFFPSTRGGTPTQKGGRV